MYVKVMEENSKLPVGMICPVILKTTSFDDYYVVQGVEGYYMDNSSLREHDKILYRAPFVTEENGWIVGEPIPKGYTWIAAKYMEEMSFPTTNKNSISLLDKEY